MPILEFVCPCCKFVTEKFYPTISGSANVICTVCKGPECGYARSMRTIVSPPLQAHLYGNPDGYHNPSPTKRYTTKTVSQLEGNRSASG